MALSNQQPSNYGRRSRDRWEVAKAGRRDSLQQQDQIDQSSKSALIIDSDKIRNTEPFTEGQQIDEPSKVVLVIVVLTLIYIAVVFYFVTQMPKQ